MPGLACDPARLWSSTISQHSGARLTRGYSSLSQSAWRSGLRTKPNDDGPWTWDWRPLTLPINARPTPITFEQYLTWCPEAKFELMDGKPQIGGWEGTRNVLGLLLMTFGLEEVVLLQHPQAWVAALHAGGTGTADDAGAAMHGGASPGRQPRCCRSALAGAGRRDRRPAPIGTARLLVGTHAGGVGFAQA